MKQQTLIAFAALAAAALLGQPALARERIHYIAADEVVWNYAPQGMNVITGKPLPRLSKAQLGWRYYKALYREYTDASFATVVPEPPADRYLGWVGPVIHAEVGDTVKIVFRNRASMPFDIVPGGVPSIPKASAVPPGSTRTYIWPVTAADGPGPSDGSSIVYVYTSDTRGLADQDAGLIGPLIITRRGSARPDGSPSDVDQEIVALFSAQEETLNPYLSKNISDPSINPRHVSASAPNFLDDNAMTTINGFNWGNMPMPVLRAGTHVRWYMLETANEFDAHAPTWTGQTVLYQGTRADVIPLLVSHETVDMTPDNPGIWLLKCTLNVHLMNGMEALYKVTSR